jgi:hypothetical protein
MKITLSFEAESLDELESILQNAPGKELSISPETPNSEFPDLPNVAEPKAKRTRAASKKIVDPGDSAPPAGQPGASPAIDPFATAAPEAAQTPATGPQFDDFGDPIQPIVTVTPAGVPSLTLDFLRTQMQNKSMINDTKKAAAKALIASYNVQTLSMIPEEKWPEFYAKLQQL